MSKRWILAGSTDQTIDIFVQDSSSTTGAGLTGLTSATSGLTCYYRKGATGTPTALTLTSQTVGGAHTDGGFVAVDATNMPGVYRLDLSDTIVASAGMVTLFLRGATNMAPLPLEIEVVSVNPYDSAAFGLSRLDAAVSSRLASASYTTPPTAEANATAVRTELTTELGRIDVATSTRLATSGYTAPPTEAAIADAVWDEATTGHTTADTYGGRVLRATNSNVAVQVTGSSHVAADLHESQPNSIHATTFDAGAIDAAALATDAANEIADALLDRANAVETGLSVRGAFRLSTAALLGKLSGAATNTVTIRNVGDTINRIVATVDADGNRSAVTTDAT